MSYYLVNNSGSSSQKFELFKADGRAGDSGPDTLDLIASGNAQKVHVAGESPVKLALGDDKEERIERLDSHADAVRFFNEWLKASVPDFDVRAVCHKWVYAGEAYDGTHLLVSPQAGKTDVVKASEDTAHYFPRHTPFYLMALDAYASEFPEAPQIGSMERSLHHSIPNTTLAAGLPARFADEHTRPWHKGYHSASLRSALYNTAKALHRKISSLNLIIMHLGGTCTIQAVKNGLSVDTSLGWAASTGLIHNLAAGDVDYTLALKLQQDHGVSAEQMQEILALEGGMAALSGIDGGDLKAIMDAAEAGDSRAQFAVDTFVHTIRWYTGAYLHEALDGEADAFVFSGGIGENVPAIRSKVMRGTGRHGFQLDEAGNEKFRPGMDPVAADTRIYTADSKPILVIPTEEGRMVTFFSRYVIDRGEDLRAEDMTPLLDAFT